MNRYCTVLKESTAEYSEKRSKFIATLRHCDTEEAALEFIEEMRSRYWDARHNVFAYSVKEGMLKRFSDDGEPHGTAGKPMLDIIVGSDITNIAVVVTRYFGGVLLGTGGLVRAYSKATRDAVDAAEIVVMTPCTLYSTKCPYTDHGKLNNLIKSFDGVIEDTVFSSDVEVEYYINSEACDEFSKKLSETFSARIKAEYKEEKLFPITEN